MILLSKVLNVEILFGKKPPLDFLGGSVVKNLPANAGEAGSIPGSGRSPAGGDDNPLQYSCLEIPMDRGGWQATQSMGL